jgi:hypothetical protein
MDNKASLTLILLLVSAAPLSAGGNKKNQPNRGMLEKMEAVPCGAKQRGLSGLGSVWASAGITHIDSNEKLCPEYQLRTDEMDYQIRPTDGKHPTVLPVGQEGEFKIKKDRMFLKFPESSDHKTRTYQVVGMKPTNSDNARQNSSSKSSDTP